MRYTFWIFDRWGNQLGTLPDVTLAKHIDEINGEDSLTLEFEGENLKKGQRIVWKDKFGLWHEHIVSDLTVYHQEGHIYTSAYCENSISELQTEYIVNKRPNGNVAQMLGVALQDCRWISGTVTAKGTGSTSWYHTSVYEAITDIIGTLGGELSTTIIVGGTSIIERRVNILLSRGGDYGQLFTYGRNLLGVQRTIEPGDVYTALYGYGKGIPKYDDDGQETGGYSRKITFGEINGGKDYVTDEEARFVWGLPDGKGGIRHSFGKVEFSDCEDPVELLALTKLALEQAKEPKVQYTGSIVSLAKAGLANGEDVQTGDLIYIRDKDLGERLKGRVLRVDRDLLNEANTQITLGNLSATFTDSMKQQQSNLDWMLNQSAAWNGSSEANKAWLEHLMKSLNSEFDSVGNFRHESPEKGLIFSSVPLDENGNPTRTPATAIQLTGLGFRIASTVNSAGEFEWRTFGTGDGFTADCINTGMLRCGDNYIDMINGIVSFCEGLIEAKNGKFFINLTTGEMRISPDTQFLTDEEGNSRTLGQYFDSIQSELGDVDEALGDLDVELRQAIEDGTITEAEAAAVAKLLQRVQTEQVEAIAAFNSLYDNSLLTGSAKTTLYNAKVALYGTNGISGAYGTLVTRIQQVIACKTAAEITTAMNNYNIAYASYQSLRDTFSTAMRAAQEAISQNYADQTANRAVDAQTQQQIFDKLTNNGATQGIYMQKDPSDGIVKLYLNAEYMKLGVLTDHSGYNYWNLSTGEFRLSPNTKWGNTSKTVNDLFLELDDSMDDLDKTINNVVKDGIVTEAESAAVSKMLQRIEAERDELLAQYDKVYADSNLKGTPKTNLLAQKNYLYGNQDTGGTVKGTYPTLVEAINAVIAVKTANDLKLAMNNYNTSYKNYQLRRTTFMDALQNAIEAIQEAVAKAEAKSAVNGQTQEDIFNKLTNNSKNEGVYLDGTHLYINASMIKTGTISANIISGGVLKSNDDAENFNLNLATGVLTAKKFSINSTYFTLTQNGIMSATGASVSGTVASYHSSSKIATIVQNGYLWFTRNYVNNESLGSPNALIMTNYNETYGAGVLDIAADDISVRSAPNSTTNVSSKTGYTHYVFGSFRGQNSGENKYFVPIYQQSGSGFSLSGYGTITNGLITS